MRPLRRRRFHGGIQIIEEATEENPAAAAGLGGYPFSAYYGDARAGPPGTGRPRAANDDYDRAVELDPEDAARLARPAANSRFETGQLEAAVADYTEVIRLRPDLVDGYLQRAQSGSPSRNSKRPWTT